MYRLVTLNGNMTNVSFSLATLLSQALVAFTSEFDNEFERSNEAVSIALRFLRKKKSDAK